MNLAPVVPIDDAPYMSKRLGSTTPSCRDRLELDRFFYDLDGLCGATASCDFRGSRGKAEVFPDRFELVHRGLVIFTNDQEALFELPRAASSCEFGDQRLSLLGQRPLLLFSTTHSESLSTKGIAP